MSNKVVIVGTGNVGMSYAYALLNQRTQVNELVLIDINNEDAEGEALDLNDALPVAPSYMKIKAGNYGDCCDADIVCITAGVPQQPGESRMDLINKNAVIFKDMVGQIMNSGFSGIFIVVSNPMDVMTHLTWKFSGLPQSRVIGSGTVLDSARLRFALSQKLGIGPRDIQAYVIGEHGDSEFVPWNNANVGLQKVTGFLSQDELVEIEEQVRNAAYTIIDKKGATYYGIGMALTKITSAILSDENAVLPVSNFDPSSQVYVGLPAVINRDGIREKIYIELTEEEQRKLDSSIGVIKEAIQSVESSLG